MLSHNGNMRGVLQFSFTNIPVTVAITKVHKELTSGLDTCEENNCKQVRGYALM